MARISNVLFVALLVAVAAAMVAAAPPVTKAKISKATTAEKMNEIKLATTSKASSQALQEADNATATEDADDDSESDEPDGVLDDPDDAGKQGFFKNIIGGSSPMDGNTCIVHALFICCSFLVPIHTNTHTHTHTHTHIQVWAAGTTTRPRTFRRWCGRCPSWGSSE